MHKPVPKKSGKVLSGEINRFTDSQQNATDIQKNNTDSKTPTPNLENNDGFSISNQNGHPKSETNEEKSNLPKKNYDKQTLANEAMFINDSFIQNIQN